MREPICIAILSDLHVNLVWNWAKRIKDLKKAMENLQGYEEVKGLYIVGDVSDYGLSIQMRKTCQILHEYEKQSGVSCFVTLGNHDLRHFLPFLSSPLKLMNKTRQYLYHPERKTVYEVTNLEYIPVLLLASERNLKNDAYLSFKQISWISSQLDQHKQSSCKLIINHQPLSNTHPKSEIYGLGKQDEIVKKILQKHENIVWISGHLHNDARSVSYIQNEYGIQLDLPSFHVPLNKEAPIGCGCLLYIHEEYILVKVIDFIEDELIQSYQINLKHL